MTSETHREQLTWRNVQFSTRAFATTAAECSFRVAEPPQALQLQALLAFLTRILPIKKKKQQQLKKSSLQINYTEVPCSSWGLALFFHSPGRVTLNLPLPLQVLPRPAGVSPPDSPRSSNPTHIHLVHPTWFRILNEGFLFWHKMF